MCHYKRSNINSETPVNPKITFIPIIEKMYKRNGGQGLLEFALILPLLTVVLFGVFDLGRLYFSSITLTSAAREGARYLSVYPKDLSNPSGEFYQTKLVTQNEASNSGITLEMEQITAICTHSDPEVCDSGKPAMVTVTHDFELILGWLLPSPIPITRTAQIVVP